MENFKSFINRRAFTDDQIYFLESTSGKYQVDEVKESPKVLSSTQIAFPVSSHELDYGHCLLFKVPSEFQGRTVQHVILRHRKSDRWRKEWLAKDPEQVKDPYGAVSRVEIQTQKGDWVSWIDPKGYNPDKFAEPRSAGDPEEENLHDWINVGDIKPIAVRVANVGRSSNHPDQTKYATSTIHGLDIVFMPPTSAVTNTIERIFVKGTSFIDLGKGTKLPQFGGGSHTYGKYEGALVMNAQKMPLFFNVTTNPGPSASWHGDEVVIGDLPVNSSLIHGEVAIGDSEYLDYVREIQVDPIRWKGKEDQLKNTYGYMYEKYMKKNSKPVRYGYAKLDVGIKKADKTVWFLRNGNVPPQGVLEGSPFGQDGGISPGDKIVLRVSADTAYIMGWRFRFGPQS